MGAELFGDVRWSYSLKHYEIRKYVAVLQIASHTFSTSFDLSPKGKSDRESIQGSGEGNSSKASGPLYNPYKIRFGIGSRRRLLEPVASNSWHQLLVWNIRRTCSGAPSFVPDRNLESPL